MLLSTCLRVTDSVCVDDCKRSALSTEPRAQHRWPMLVFTFFLSTPSCNYRGTAPYKTCTVDRLG